VSARAAVAQPTTLLANASRTLASHSTPSPVMIRVRSATHSRFGAVAVKSRQTRSGAAAWRGFCRVEPPFQPRRRNAPCRPCSRMIRSTRLRPQRTPWRRSASHTRGEPYVPANSCAVRILTIISSSSASSSWRRLGAAWRARQS
jgi:hypothetical protein